MSTLMSFAQMPMDIARHLLGSGFWSRLGHFPLADVAVPENFLGINVAGSPDPAVQAYVFERLEELGLRQVRVDAGYDAPNNFQEDFIQELIQRGYAVQLRLRQTPAAAAGMCKEVQARRAWSAHIQWAIDRFDVARLDGLELGSTPNRKRWSGYRYREYFTAWKLACEVLGDRPIRLVGPGVSDFEPLHALCMLRGLKSAGRLPAVHGVNMFCERTRIPEAWDHRVAGRALTGTLKLNLIKKLRVFEAIQQQFGLAETWCTHSCWNAERVARWSDEVEADRADYMKRYLLLAAASGAVQRVYWGPLVGYPDGLIFEGTARHGPDRERVASYSLSPGRVSDLRPTPSFEMLKDLQALLPGSTLSLGIDEGAKKVLASIRGHGALTTVAYQWDECVTGILPVD